MKRILTFVITLVYLNICAVTGYASADYALAEFAGITPELTNIDNVIPGRDNLFAEETKDGIPCVRMYTKDAEGNPVNGSWLAFDINRDYMVRMKDGTGVDITVEYFDEGDGTFCIVYDARNERKKPSEKVLLNGTNTWKTHTFHLYDAYFGNRCESKDFLLTLYDSSIDFSTSDLIFKSVKVEKSGKILPLDLTENFTHTGNLYTKGEIPVISVSVENILESEVEANYICTITNSEGENVRTINDTMTFYPGANTLEINTGLSKCDTYDVEFIFSDESDLYGEFRTNFAISVASEPNCDYATNTHYRITARDPQKSIPLVKNSGSSMIRDGMPWENCVDENGIFTMPDAYKAYIDEAIANGLEVCVLLGSQKEEKFPRTDADIKAYGDYVYNAVRALKGKVEYFEIWNEFHHTAYKLGITTSTDRKNPSDAAALAYVNVLKEAYTRAKEANPDCKIIGMGGLPAVWDGWIKAVLKNGAGDYMDIMSLHEYDEYNPPEKSMIRWLNNVKSHIQTYGCEDIPIWITEAGWSTSWDVSKEEKSKYSFGIRQYILYKEFGIEKYFWYDFKSDGVNSRDYQDNFGTIWYHNDREHVPYSARESYLAFANMNDKIGNAVIAEHTTDGNSAEIYKFIKQDGDETYVLWNATCDSVAEITLDVTKSWRLYDAFGNENKLTVMPDGRCTVDVSGEPVYISHPESYIETGVTDINYITGEISVRISGFDANEFPGILVSKPEMDLSDIEKYKLDALAYMGQPEKGVESFSFKFTADEEGLYNIYANTGYEILQIGAAYYKPMGFTAEFKQGSVVITDFGQIQKNQPITVKATIDNTYGGESDYVLVFAKYRDGVLIDAVSKSGHIKADVTSSSVNTEITAEHTDFDAVKIYLWRDNTRLIPLSDSVEISE